MRASIAIFATLLAGACAVAQQDPASSSGPFTWQEAEQMSAVWPEIRQAERFEEINWEAVGLGVAPGNAEARRLLATHWDALRSAAQFSDIDWQAVPEYRASSSSPFGQQDQSSRSGPFTGEEANEMSAVWPEIRNAPTFEEIDWGAVGLGVAPGNAEARRLMAINWDNLRRAARFNDINWEETTGYRAASRGRFERQDQAFSTGPFTRQEAEEMSAAWPEIRQAARFEDINWEAVGLGVAPGNADARRLMATHWDTVRRAARFSDIDWQAITGYRNR